MPADGELLPEELGLLLTEPDGVLLAGPLADGLELAVPVPDDGLPLPESEGVLLGLVLPELLGLLLTEPDGVSEGVPKLGELLGVSEADPADGLELPESEGEPDGDSLAVPMLGVRSAGAASQSDGGEVKLI